MKEGSRDKYCGGFQGALRRLVSIVSHSRICLVEHMLYEQIERWKIEAKQTGAVRDLRYMSGEVLICTWSRGDPERINRLGYLNVLRKNGRVSLEFNRA